MAKQPKKAGLRIQRKSASAKKKQKTRPTAQVRQYISLREISHALQAAKVGIWEWIIPTNQVLWSNEVLLIFGLQKNGFDGTFESYTERVHPDDRDLVNKAIERSLNEGKPYFIEHRLLHADGTIHWLEASGEVFFGPKRKPLKMTGSVRDVTEKKINEKKHHEWKARYDLLIESSGIVIYDFTIATGLIEWSSTLQEVLGYAPEEMDHIQKWIELIHPDDREQSLSEVEWAERELANYDLEFRILHKKGTYRHLHARGSFIADEHQRAVRILGSLTDITEQRKAEEDKKEIEQSYQKLFDNASDAIFTMSLEADTLGQIISANQAAAKMHGYTLDEFLKLNIKDIDEPEDYKAISSQISRLIKDDRFVFEINHLRKNGTIFPVEVVASIFEVKEKKVLLAIDRDISERRRSEEILKESEERFRILIRNLHVGVLLQGPSAEILLSNQAALELLGLTESQLMGRSPMDMEWNVIHENGSDFPLADQPVPVALKTKQPVRGAIMGVYRPQQKDRKWLHVDAIPLMDREGHIAQVICSFTDISERKATEEHLRESEQRFRTLHNASHGGIAIHDLGIIIDANQGLADISGYTIHELIGMNGLQLVVPEQRDTVMKKIRENDELPYDLKGLRKDGTTYYLEVQGKSIPYKGRNVRITEFRDISDRKYAEEKIREQNSRLLAIAQSLRRKNEQLEEFTQIVSHNLRSPAGNINSLIELLEKSESSEDKAHIVSLLRESSGSLISTLHELNEVLQIKQNKNIEKQELRFEDVFIKVKNMLTARISEISAQVTCQFEDAPALLYPNIYLESIFLNLLSNALKYNDLSRPSRIHFQTRFQEGKQVILEVHDNGLGIDLNKYGHQIFKLRKTFHKHRESRGVGLFMIKSQIETMGGEIKIESEEGKGTVFIINFNKNQIDT